ncbi:hypothetical protein GCM10011505_17260 [Tistrella bauzanensis]|uniref:Nitronate monooxygenase n=1 Tax=Tistrella bauzanensis TaxID=657419 RepID=A0ABQ1IH59_9PROT|nr:nitronate monooxygenase [Tistrella bauzanensis]GGB36346.1 hypothetical protein GCM10011505_17260 [Tistrella bauzanensis]
MGADTVAPGRAAALVDARLPVFQAGMGGIAGPCLVAAVAEAGGAGIIGLYKHNPDEIAALIAEAADLTDRPFGINLVPEVVSEPTLLDQVRGVTQAPAARPFVTFYGLPPAAAIRLARDAGRVVIVQTGSVFDAVEAVRRGAGAIVIQGHEAGGHHLSARGVLDLVAAVAERLPEIPLIAAGGISDANAAAMAAAAGADAVLAGTAFICATESAAHDHYRARVLTATGADQTVITDRFEIGWAGRRHRVLRNAVTEAATPPAPTFIGRTVLFGRPYPVPCGSAAVPTIHTSGRIDDMALYCGTGCDAVTAIEPAADIVRRLAAGVAQGRAARRPDARPAATAAIAAQS